MTYINTSDYSSYKAITTRLPVPTLTGTNTVLVAKIEYNKITGSNGYTVYRSNSETGTYIFVGFAENLYYTDSKSLVGTPYYYKVRAYKIVNNKKYYGIYSNIVSAMKEENIEV